MIVSPWVRIHKGDVKARELADRHYTRQTPGHPMWTRPGYNFCLFADYNQGSALFCFWRPKWESDLKGAQRKDGLRVLECTMFRREGKTELSSVLIRKAVSSLLSYQAVRDLKLYKAGVIEELITGVSTDKTKKCRSKKNSAGQCFIHAGWKRYNKETRRADTWLYYPWKNIFSLTEQEL